MQLQKAGKILVFCHHFWPATYLGGGSAGGSFNAQKVKGMLPFFRLLRQLSYKCFERHTFKKPTRVSYELEC